MKPNLIYILKGKKPNIEKPTFNLILGPNCKSKKD